MFRAFVGVSNLASVDWRMRDRRLQAANCNILLNLWTAALQESALDGFTPL
jgi:hypothetical protein